MVLRTGGGDDDARVDTGMRMVLMPATRASWKGDEERPECACAGELCGRLLRCRKEGEEPLRDAPGQGDGERRVVGLESPLLSPEIEEDGGGDTSSGEQFGQPWGELDVVLVGK